jgi:sterol desaturase/sphingolipid hydroxylase (fatty acid hydroxylase superfamily)
MDDAIYGKRNKRGDWAPHAPINYAPLFDRPAKPLTIAKWLAGLPGYFLPWNALYAGLAALCWFYATPSLETMQHFAPGWIALIFMRNALLVGLLTGAWHVALYVKQSQGKAFKYNSQWPPTNNTAFLFNNQNVDNMIWTFASGVPFWTAYEVVVWWLFANHAVPFVSWTIHPIYCTVILLLIPALREVHFYLVHRLIHWPPLYRAVHKLHHNNVNPGPWSGLAMHPVEHLLYFSGVLVHLVLPSHPIHAMFHLLHAALTPAQGHVGFDKVVVGGEKGFDTHSYAHYLHHKYFECNYADGNIPLDRWFGTFHDGSKEGQAAMDARWAARAAKINAEAQH